MTQTINIQSITKEMSVARKALDVAQKQIAELSILKEVMTVDEAHKIIKGLNAYYFYMQKMAAVEDLPGDLIGWTLQDLLTAYSIIRFSRPTAIQFDGDKGEEKELYGEAHIARVFALLHTLENTKISLAGHGKMLFVVPEQAQFSFTLKM